ncbi:MAG: nitroreductase family protein [Acidimicrobiia bacterium]|nr:nitroreductase family protein [Acidimicrobiia bacterium]
MEFRDVVRRRRMVRNYTGEAVDSESLDRILDAARRAPSAGHTQGQSFVVVTSAEGRQRIAELAGERLYVDRGFDPWISRAGALIVVCASEAAYHRRYSEPDKTDAAGNEIEWPVPFWWVDAGAAMMAILYAAVDEGLGAGFLGVHSVEDLSAELGIPPEITPIGVVTIGHPAPDRRSGSLSRGRRATDDVIRLESWD